MEPGNRLLRRLTGVSIGVRILGTVAGLVLLLGLGVPSARSRVAAPRRTCPPAAMLCNRCAVFTASPIAV